MTKETDLAWLAGIIDADGSIYLHIGKPASNKFIRTDILVNITMQNRDGDIWPQKVEEILYQNNIKYRRHDYAPRVPSIQKTTIIRTMSSSPSLKLLKLLKPYLTVKKKMCEIMFSIPDKKRVSSNPGRKVIFWDRVLMWAKKIDEVHNTTCMPNMNYTWTGKTFLKSMLESAKKYDFIFVDKSFEHTFSPYNNKRKEFSYKEIQEFIDSLPDYKKGAFPWL